MGASILKYIWFLLVLASGLVAVLLGLSQYGVKIDFDSWARVSSEILNGIPVLLSSPLVVSYGFYGGLFIFLVFVVLFVMASMAGPEIERESEPDYSLETGADDSALESISATDVPVQESTSDTDISVQESYSNSDESLPDPGDSSDPVAEIKPFDQISETLTTETDSDSNQDENTSDPIANEYDEVEDETDEEWKEVLQNVKVSDGQ